MPSIWKQVYDEELKRITSRHWQPGAVIATTQSLAEANGVSYITARRVLTELAKSGIVKNVPRVGCVIAEQKAKPKIYLLSPDQIPGLDMPIMISLLMKGLFEEAMRQQLELTPITTEQITYLDESQPAALIYTYNLNLMDSNVLIELLPKAIIPCGAHCPCHTTRGLAIGANSQAMATAQARTLIRHGCKKIGYVGATESPWFFPRFQSFLTTMQEERQPLSLAHVCTGTRDSIHDFRRWYDSFQPDGIFTPGIQFADSIIKQLTEQERQRTIVGSIGIPPHENPGYFYLQPDYYAEGTEIIRMIAESDLTHLSKAKPIFHMVEGTLHPINK